MNKVPITDMVKEYNLHNFTPSMNISEMYLMYPDINRPALQIAGFFEYFDSHRLQIIGLFVCSDLESLEESVRHETLTQVFDSQKPSLVLPR